MNISKIAECAEKIGFCTEDQLIKLTKQECKVNKLKLNVRKSETRGITENNYNVFYSKERDLFISIEQPLKEINKEYLQIVDVFIKLNEILCILDYKKEMYRKDNILRFINKKSDTEYECYSMIYYLPSDRSYIEALINSSILGYSIILVLNGEHLDNYKELKIAAGINCIYTTIIDNSLQIGTSIKNMS